MLELGREPEGGGRTNNHKIEKLKPLFKMFIKSCTNASYTVFCSEVNMKVSERQSTQDKLRSVRREIILRQAEYVLFSNAVSPQQQL